MSKREVSLSQNGKRIGRPRLADESVILSMRIPVEVVAALDRYVEFLQRAAPGFRVTRNDAMRRLMIVGMERDGVVVGAVEHGGKG